MQAFVPVLTVALLCTACSGKKTEKTENAVPATFTTDSVAETDSIAVGKSSAKATITMVYPADGPKDLVDSVRMWINNRLGLKDTIIADGAKVARLALVQQLDSNKVDLAGMTKDFPDYQTQYVTLWEISPVFETGKVLTYAGSIYTYTGGAHGSTVSFGSTFRTDNGKALGWDMFRSDSLVAIKNMVKEAIKTQYFKAGNNFSDYLLVKENEFPLPQTAPRFVKDGIEFIYQQYEIAPYAEGMPSCVLPYPTLIPSLIESVVPLVPDSTGQEQ